MRRPCVRVDDVSDLGHALTELGLPGERPVLAVVGGAGGLDTVHLQAIRDLLYAVLPALDTWHAAVVDGGTRSGVMELLGEARQHTNSAFALIGVTAEGTLSTQKTGVDGSDDADAESVLEPRHTHVVLVPGSDWGDESPWLAAVTTVLAGGSPSATLVLNGGDITYHDMQRSLGLSRAVLVVMGTGRAADEVARARAGDAPDQRSRAVAASPLTQVLSVDDPAGVLAGLEAALVGTSPAGGTPRST